MYFFIFSIIIFFSIDLFISGIAYGINNIKFKLKNILFITISISISILLSYTFKNIIIKYINENLFKSITFILLILLGLSKIKNYFNNNEITINPILSIKNLIILVLSLIIDNMLVSISLNINLKYFIILFISQFIIGFLVLYISNYYSYKFNKFNSKIGELLSGLLFILIAIINIFL